MSFNFFVFFHRALAAYIQLQNLCSKRLLKQPQDTTNFYPFIPFIQFNNYLTLYAINVSP